MPISIGTWVEVIDVRRETNVFQPWCCVDVRLTGRPRVQVGRTRLPAECGLTVGEGGGGH